MDAVLWVFVLVMAGFGFGLLRLVLEGRDAAGTGGTRTRVPPRARAVGAAGTVEGGAGGTRVSARLPEEAAAGRRGRRSRSG